MQPCSGWLRSLLEECWALSNLCDTLVFVKKSKWGPLVFNISGFCLILTQQGMHIGKVFSFPRKNTELSLHSQIHLGLPALDLEAPLLPHLSLHSLRVHKTGIGSHLPCAQQTSTQCTWLSLSLRAAESAAPVVMWRSWSKCLPVYLSVQLTLVITNEPARWPRVSGACHQA